MTTCRAAKRPPRPAAAAPARSRCEATGRGHQRACGCARMSSGRVDNCEQDGTGWVAPRMAVRLASRRRSRRPCRRSSRPRELGTGAATLCGARAAPVAFGRRLARRESRSASRAPVRCGCAARSRAMSIEDTLTTDLRGDEQQAQAAARTRCADVAALKIAGVSRPCVPARDYQPEAAYNASEETASGLRCRPGRPRERPVRFSRGVRITPSQQRGDNRVADALEEDFDPLRCARRHQAEVSAITVAHGGVGTSERRRAWSSRPPQPCSRPAPSRSSSYGRPAAREAPST